MEERHLTKSQQADRQQRQEIDDSRYIQAVKAFQHFGPGLAYRPISGLGPNVGTQVSEIGLGVGTRTQLIHAVLTAGLRQSLAAMSLRVQRICSGCKSSCPCSSLGTPAIRAMRVLQRLTSAKSLQKMLQEALKETIHRSRTAVSLSMGRIRTMMPVG